MIFEADEDGIGQSPPEPMRVAQRALIQSAVVCRGSIDSNPDLPVVVETHNRLRGWLEHLDLRSAMEPIEAEILSAPLGTLQRQQVNRATWAVEGLAILAWALRRFDLPGHDAKVDPFAVTNSLYFLNEEANAVRNEAELRALDELRACRELLYAIDCRFSRFRRGEGCMDIMTWIEQEWLELLGVDRSTLVVDGDLAICGKAVDEAEEDAVRDAGWITMQRHRASNWLVGEYPLYTETPADT